MLTLYLGNFVIPFHILAWKKLRKKLSAKIQILLLCRTLQDFCAGPCHYDIIVAKHYGCWYLIWYQCLEETPLS